MDQVNGPFIAGKGYRFEDQGFFWEEYPDMVRYEDVTHVTNAEGSGTFDISFQNAKGKKRDASVILNNRAQEQPLRALLSRRIPGAAPGIRTQTAWEACRSWLLLAVCLDGLVAIIIALNNWGQGATVSVPVWALPILMIGRLLSTEALLAIGAVLLILCVIGAVHALMKRKPVWEIK